MSQKITIQTIVNVPIEKIWKYWNEPEHIVHWCSASPDWHTPNAENDLKIGGKFLTRMEAKDGSAGFDFGGTYTAVDPFKKIEYTMDDGRKVSIDFIKEDAGCKIIESFDPENENPLEMQRTGWQTILNNFKNYTENK